MEGNLSEALLLMGVGLATVFLVLLLVIAFGNILIKAVNKFAPEEEKPKQIASKPAAALIDGSVQQAINKAVEQLTGGKGRVEKIVKL
ncbi:MAG: OadG family protein [Bacteroidales bacterium]|nr:OadG family protein [Bacteroidales bacterium]